jgi:hypothetical protein
VLGQLATGSGDVWRGGSVDAAWRGWRPAIRLAAFGVETSYPFRVAGSAVRGEQLLGGRARVDYAYAFDRADVRVGIGATVSHLDEQTDNSIVGAGRSLGFAELAGGLRRSGDPVSASLAASGNVAAGVTGGMSFQRFLASLAGRASMRGVGALDATASYGALSTEAPTFERFAIGGPAIALLDPTLVTQRLPMGALPGGVATGDRVLSYRIATSLHGLSPYYWGASTGEGGRRFSTWLRVTGAELTIDHSALPVLGLPGARLIAGIGYSLDRPFAHETRGYLSIILRP